MNSARFRRSRPVDPRLVERFRETLHTFLKRTSLSESVLIFDGVGVGCPTPLLLLSLIGYDRMKEIGEIHVFSASTYSTLYFLAHHQGQSKLNEAMVQNLCWDVQKIHRIVPVWSLLSLAARKLIGRKHLYPSETVELVLRHGCSDEFCCRSVDTLPKNLFFWTYDLAHDAFTRIHSDSDLSDMTTGQLARAVAGWSHVYEPLDYRGHRFTDAVGGPRLREVFRKFRNLDRNCLFLHMNRQGEFGRTLYLKAHQGASGKERLFLDFLYFYLGINSREVNDLIRMSLFEIEPVML